MTRLLHCILFTVLLLGTASLWGKTGKNQSENVKADYMFLEAASAFDRENYEQGYLLLRKAYSLNPSDPYIAGRLAEISLLLPTADSTVREKAYRAILRRFEVDPADETNANIAANLAAQRQDYDALIHIWSAVDSVSTQRADAALNLADALMRRYAMERDSADRLKGIAVLERLEKLAGPTTPITVRKISAFLLDNDSAAAMAEAKKYVASAPADPKVMLNAGMFYEHLNRPDSARLYYDKAARLDPDNGEIHITRANFFNRLNDSIAFDSEVVRALESSQLEFEQKMPLLAGYVQTLYADTANWERIDRMFGVMQEINAGEPELHDYYSYFKAFQGNQRGAAEQLAYAIDLDPDNVERRRQFVATLYAIPDSVAAGNAAWQIHHDFPNDANTTLFLASTVAQKGRNNLALAMLDSITVDSVSDTRMLSSVYATKGDILAQASQIAKSSEAYAKALEYDPENYMAMNNMAYFYAVADTLLEKAEIYASMAVSSDPANPTFLDTYAWVFFKKKSYDKAKEYINMALETYNPPENQEEAGLTENEEPAESPTFEIYDHAGDIYFMNGEYEQALKFWEEALKLNPSDKKTQEKVKIKAYIPD